MWKHSWEKSGKRVWRTDRQTDGLTDRLTECKPIVPSGFTGGGLIISLTIDLLTWISIEIIFSSRTIYLLSLKLLGQSILELSVAEGVGDWHDLWPWPADLSINRDHLLTKDYLPTKFEASGAKCCWVISCTRCGRLTWPLTYWPEY